MIMNQKGDDDMRTPTWLFFSLYNIFTFNVDAACTRKNSLCGNGFYHDKGFDGLKMPWNGYRIFCNPPFSGKAKWIEKAHREVADGGCPVCVMLLPTNSMDSKPWHEFIYGKYHYEIIDGRVSFIDSKTGKPKNGNNSGTTVVYFMKKPIKPMKQ